MRIDRLALKNFKCFKEVDVSFSKITLLTGENSSGKSSLIYGLLAPFQSVNWLGNSFPLYISLNGRYVNMGGFEEVSFNHNVNNILGIDLDCYIGNQKCSFTTDWQFQVKSKSPILYHLKLLDNSEQIEIRYTENANYIASFKFTNIRIPEISDLVIENIDDVRIDKIGDITKERDDTYPIFDMLNDLSNSLECDFNFISSFRLHPERTYYQTLLEDKIDRFGNGYIDQILVWSDNQSERLLKLASILKSLKILYDIKPYRLSGGRFEIKVKVKSKSKWESLADVGFGISQFLPIIVADLQLLDDSTLIMSQPEIHLHPSVQANLGDYLVKQVKERNKNYIVETHSEYLLNRMRLLIVKGEIQPEDVAVYYFENSIKDGSIAHRIEFTKDGQILNAPKGFFETYMIDTMDIALNA